MLLWENILLGMAYFKSVIYDASSDLILYAILLFLLAR